MTEKELKKKLMEYEAFIRFDEEDKEELCTVSENDPWLFQKAA